MLFASACGRVGFDPIARPAPDAADDAPPGMVTWVKVFVGQAVTTGTLTDRFTTAATSAGDAVTATGPSTGRPRIRPARSSP